MTIDKADTSITTPPIASDIINEQPLSASNLSSGVATAQDGTKVEGDFAWASGNIVPGVGTHSYEVRFTPDDTTNYNQSTTQVTVTVEPKH